MSTSIKVMQVNALHRSAGESNDDTNKRHENLCLLIKDLSPDIVTMQEIPGKGSLLPTVMTTYGFNGFVNPFDLRDKRENTSRTGLFSKHQIAHIPSSSPYYIWGKMTIEGVNIYACSHHGVWGADRIQDRMRILTQIDRDGREFKNHDPESLVLMGADINGFDDGREFNYLRGRDLNLDNESTYWLDAWHLKGTQENWKTVSTSNALAAKTAFFVGITDPSSAPDRRIDGIFTQGWNHGRRGDILSFSTISAEDITDHEILLASIAL